MSNSIVRIVVLRPQQVRIGEWWANRTTNELGRAGETVRIEPKAMEVLMALAAHAGEAVSREALLDAVWSGLVVGDDALTQSIIKLRKALGDNPRSPSYIETISKRGYRLIAPVQTAEVAAGDGDIAAQSIPPAPRRGVALWGLAAGVALALLAVGTYFLHAWNGPSLSAQTDALEFADDETPGRLTVAVLPFETLGSGAEQAYLARGISSDLMTDLARLSSLRLINAAGAAAGAQAAKLSRYVVSGSVQVENARLRINVRLTDSKSHELLWSQRYERPFGDLLAIQNEIGRDLAEQLPVAISDVERRQLAKRYTSSPEAYEYFLRGKELFLVRRPAENAEARAHYEKAIELDPQFSRAYAGLAMTYAMEYRYQRSAGSSAALVRAMELAETARQIDPGIAEVYWAIGFIQAQGRRFDAAIQTLQKAIELNRSYADAYALLGGIDTYVGRADRSIPLLRTALRLNPDGGYLYFLLLGRAYFFDNDVDQALINLREALLRDPDNLEAHVYLAAAWVAKGDYASAESEVDEIRTREAGFTVRRWLETYPLTSAAYQERLLNLAAKLGL